MLVVGLKGLGEFCWSAKAAGSGPAGQPHGVVEEHGSEGSRSGWARNRYRRPRAHSPTRHAARHANETVGFQQSLPGPVPETLQDEVEEKREILALRNFLTFLNPIFLVMLLVALPVLHVPAAKFPCLVHPIREQQAV